MKEELCDRLYVQKTKYLTFDIRMLRRCSIFIEFSFPKCLESNIFGLNKHSRYINLKQKGTDENNLLEQFIRTVF